MRTAAEITAWREANPGARLCLSGADLSGADLSGANLWGANLSDADLSGANLSDADLSGADLSGADLYAALPLLTAAPSATRDEVARSIPVDALATFITGHGGDFETGQWRVELAFPLSEPVSVDSWRQDLIDAITPKEDR